MIKMYLTVVTREDGRHPGILVTEKDKWIIDRWIHQCSPEEKLIVYEMQVKEEDVNKFINLKPNKEVRNEKYFSEAYFKKHGRVIYRDSRRKK